MFVPLAEQLCWPDYTIAEETQFLFSSSEAEILRGILAKDAYDVYISVTSW